MFHNIYRIKEHLILKLDQGMWLLDTGAPESFGSINKLVIDGQSYEVGPRSGYHAFHKPDPYTCQQLDHQVAMVAYPDHGHRKNDWQDPE